jgi:hypothetical protein
MRFLKTESCDYIGVAQIRRIARTWTGWMLYGDDDGVLGRMAAGFRPESLNESHVAAAAGSTCLVVCSDGDTGEVYAETHPVVAWRVSREREPPVAKPVLVEEIPSNAVIVAVPMADGRWCEPDIQMHASLDTLIAEARTRIRHAMAPMRPAAGRADTPASPQQEKTA